LLIVEAVYGVRVSTDAVTAARRHRESMDATEFLTRLHRLPFDERFAIASKIPECGHAIGELQSALADLDRELAAAFSRERSLLEASLVAAEFATGRAA
jgi:hypothetical protein